MLNRVLQRPKTPETLPSHKSGHPPTRAGAMALRQIPILGAFHCGWMSQSLVLWKPGIGGLEGGIGAGAADVAGFFSLGEQNPVSVDPMGWLPRVMPLHVKVGGVWVKDNLEDKLVFEFMESIRWL